MDFVDDRACFVGSNPDLQGDICGSLCNVGPSYLFGFSSHCRNVQVEHWNHLGRDSLVVELVRPFTDRLSIVPRLPSSLQYQRGSVMFPEISHRLIPPRIPSFVSIMHEDGGFNFSIPFREILVVEHSFAKYVVVAQYIHVMCTRADWGKNSI